MDPSTLQILLVAPARADSLSIRQLLARSTLAAAWVTEVVDAAAARAICQSTPPDCILLVDHPPVNDGLALLAGLQAGNPVPILLCGGMIDDERIARALHAGAQDYLITAALSPTTLLLAIERAVTVARLTRACAESRAMLTTLFATIPLGIGVLDATLRFSQLNDTLAELLGAPTTTLVGQPLAQYATELATALAQPAAQVLATGQPAGPLVIPTANAANQAAHHWQVHLSPLTRPDQPATELVLVLQAVPAHPQVSDQWLRLALSAARLRAWEWDIAAGSVTFSGYETHAFNMAPVQCTYSLAAVQAMVYPPDLPAYDQAVMAAIRHTAPYQLQVRVGNPDGKFRWVEVHGRAQHDAQGQAVRVVGVTRDINDEKRRMALQALHTTIGHALASANDVMATLDTLARLPLPALADRCTSFVCHDDALLVPTACYAGDPAMPLPSAAWPSPQPLYQIDSISALSTGEPVPWPLLWIPLRNDGQVLGALLLERTGDIRPYDVDDLTLAEALARRGATALVQAHLATRARAAQQAATATHARLDALIASAPNGIGYLDQTLHWVLINPALAALTGLLPEAHLGQTLAETFASLAPQIEPIVHAVQASGVAVRDQEVRAHPPQADSAGRNWLVSSFPIPNSAGIVDGVGVMITDVTVQRHTAAALRASEARFRLFAEHAHDIIFRFSLAPAQGIEYLNPVVEQLTGYPREAFYRDLELYRQLVHPDDLVHFEHMLISITAQKQPVLVRGHHRDGTPFWVELQSWLVNDETGQALVVEGIARDITARRQAEEALQAAYVEVATHAQAAHAQAVCLDSILTHAPVGISLLDPQLRFQQINPHLAAINGLAPDAHLGRTIGEVLPGLVAQLEGYYGHVLATGQPLLDVEVVGETPAAPGVQRRWRASYFPVRASDGPLMGIGVIVVDITEQRRMEQALHTHHQQLEAILQSLDEGVVAIQPDYTFTLVNPAAARQMLLSFPAPLTEAPVTAATALQLLTPEGALLPAQEWPAVRVVRGERFSNLELRMRVGAARDERWMAFSGVPVYDNDGQFILGVLTGRDITRHKHDAAALAAHTEVLSRTNAELARALKLKDEFLAMMSHELRTPLNVVLGITEALETELYGPLEERQRKALNTIMRSGRHLLAILADILDLTHIMAGKVLLDRQPLDVDLLCRAAFQFVRDAAQKKAIQLQRTMMDAVKGMVADERRLTQILVNLLDNAVKFTPNGGRVGLEVIGKPTQEIIQFVVWDTGIGIAEADYARLFQPFTQVEGGLTRPYGGVGLGLTLVRKLVDLHGGSVILESTPGQGSRFTVNLPWSDAENVVPPASPVPTPWPHSWAQPLRLVIADDHEPTLAFYADLLSRQGCAVTVARTGIEALAQVYEQRPAVVILDIQIPELDGLAVIRRLRTDDRLAGMRIIALTALAMPGDRERCLEAGADVYLAKPVSLRELVATITHLSETTPPHQP